MGLRRALNGEFLHDQVNIRDAKKNRLGKFGTNMIRKKFHRKKALNDDGMQQKIGESNEDTSERVDFDLQKIKFALYTKHYE